MKFFISIFAISLLFACASKSTLPSWVLTPASSSHSICGVGDANLKDTSNKSELYKVAKIKAMADIARAQSLLVEGEVSLKNSGKGSSASSSSIHSSNMAFIQTAQPVEVNSYMDNSSGTFYLLLCLE